MEVSELVDFIQRVCGLPANWAKTCIYYCMATHKLDKIKWMVALIILAPPGSGKTWLIKVLTELCFNTYNITCFDKMTSTSLRNELVKAKNRTAIIEEGDLYPRRKELETYIINRVDKIGTSALPVTQPVITDTGAQGWKTIKFSMFGATILHDRHEPNDLATERRSIIVPIKHQTGKIFYKPTDKELREIKLPKFSFGDIPDIFNSPEISGSALDAWEPLLRIASDDFDWLDWAYNRAVDATATLAEGYEYELKQTVFKAVIKGYYRKDIKKLDFSDPLPLPTVTATVKESYKWMQPKTVSTTLRKMSKPFNIDIHTLGGVVHIFAKEEQIREMARELGCEDDAFK